MFEVGEYIIYGNHGVCKIEDIGNPDMPGFDENKNYYKLQPISLKSSTLYTPVDNNKVVMRRIITDEEARQLLEQIQDTPLLWIENDKQREEVYKETLKKHNCTDLIKIIKTLYVRKQERISQGKKMTFIDEKYLSISKDCLYGELSIAMDMSRDEIESLVVKYLEKLNMV